MTNNSFKSYGLKLLSMFFGIILLSGSGLLISSEQKSFGYFCDISTNEAFSTADIVFYGKAVRNFDDISEPRVISETEFKVIKQYKGNVTDSVIIRSDDITLQPVYDAGEIYFVFANIELDSKLSVEPCNHPTDVHSLNHLKLRIENYLRGYDFVDSPVKQFNSGVPLDEILCSEHLVLIQKYDGSPACVTKSTKHKLIERGWISQDSTVSVNECKKGIPPRENLVFFDCKWVEIPYGWTYEHGRWQEDPTVLKLGPEPEPSCPQDGVCTCDGKYAFYNKTTNRCDSSPYMPQYYQRDCEQYADLDFNGWMFDENECDWNQLDYQDK